MERLASGIGFFGLLTLVWMAGRRRGRVDPRTVLWGIGLQWLLAFLILQTTIGRATFEWLASVVQHLVAMTSVGTRFLVGDDLASLVAFQALPPIIFFSALAALAEHYGVLSFVVRWLGRGLSRSLGTSGAESLAAAGNVFLGPATAPLLIRPWIETSTRSELFSLMTVGFATVAANMFGAYQSVGVDARHLLAASVLSAPAGLLVAKLWEPETAVPSTTGDCPSMPTRTTSGGLDAIARGTTDGLRLAASIAAMLLVFVGLVALVNSGVTAALGEPWSLERVFGYVFAPVAVILGVPFEEARRVGELLGVKIVLNEFLAYERMSSWATDGATALSDRARTITTYALCSFGNFGTMGIVLAGFGALAPSRRSDVASLCLRAMIAGNIAGFLTACVAGMIL